MILAIDQGTTSSRAILFDETASVVAKAQKEFKQYYPKPGWVEHDANEIWNSVQAVVKEALKKSELKVSDISAIGITNQRETAVVWNRKTGEPIAPAIVWQSRQTVDICNEVRDAGHSDLIREKTGLIIDAYFSGSKVKWLLDNVPGARELANRGELCFGTIDSWLIWKLSGNSVHTTDYSNASRTMLFNINELCWDSELLEIFSVPEVMLPTLSDSSGIIAETDPEIFGARVPIAGVAGDQQAALFGQMCFKPGQVKNTYGTGCFMLMNSGREPVLSNSSLLSTIAWRIGGEVEYALEGSVFIAGAAIQWLRDELKIVSQSAETSELASSLESNEGVYLIPAFVGLGAPYWDSEARGAIFGLTRGSGRANIVRAALESLAYQTRDIIDCMRADSRIGLDCLRVDGGAASNEFLMQFQSDILGVDVIRTTVTESTALGAALLAGLAVGVWRDKQELTDLLDVDKIYSPVLTQDVSNKYYKEWQRAVEATRVFKMGC